MAQRAMLGKLLTYPALGALLILLALPLSARAELAGHGGFVKGVAVSPDGRTALTASFDYTVIYWDLAEERALFSGEQIDATIT